MVRVEELIMDNQAENFTLYEWEKLSTFGLKPFDSASSFSIDTSTLLNDKACLNILNQIMVEIGAPNLKVTASLVIKRMAFLVLAPMLYSMSKYNKGLDVSIKNCIFEFDLEKRIWKSGLPLKSIKVTLAPNNRDIWREQVSTQAFKGHLSLLIEQFYRLTRTSKRILWENVAVRVFSIYENRILRDLCGRSDGIAKEDFLFLLNPDTHKIFGLEANPLEPFFKQKKDFLNTSTPIRFRKTCCFYYRATDPVQYCSNCPLLLKGN